MRKYGENKTTRIMMATVPHVTSGLGLRKFKTDGFLLTRVYNSTSILIRIQTCVQFLISSTLPKVHKAPELNKVVSK